MQSGDDQATVKGYILVADDDPIVRMVVKKILDQAAYNADFVCDGKEAVKTLKSNPYDLVLMDCLMPGMDGFEATRLIRTTASGCINPGIPVIAMTGLSAEGDESRCMDAGMDTYISKPVDPQLLISTIEQFLGRTGGEGLEPDRLEMKPEQTWDDEFLDKIIDKFLAEVPKVTSDLQSAIRQGNVGALQGIGHRLKGATDILGALTLSALAQDLEQAGKGGDRVSAEKLASKLIEELEKLTVVLAD